MDQIFRTNECRHVHTCLTEPRYCSTYHPSFGGINTKTLANIAKDYNVPVIPYVLSLRSNQLLESNQTIWSNFIRQYSVGKAVGFENSALCS